MAENSADDDSQLERILAEAEGGLRGSEPEERRKGLERLRRTLLPPEEGMSTSASECASSAAAVAGPADSAASDGLGLQVVSESDQAESDHVTLTPVSYADAHAVGETFRDGVPVLMNLTSMETMDAKRTIDFTAGLVFGLRGTIERVATRAFLLSPAQAAVANDQGLLGLQVVSKSDQAESDHVTLTPVSYADAHAVGETFRDGVPVLMNLTSMETMDAKRTIDFTAGLVFGLRGTIERVATRAFLLSPAQAAVANDQDSERSQNGLLPDRPGAHQAAAGLGRRGP